jgi:hypothetical protein
MFQNAIILYGSSFWETSAMQNCVHTQGISLTSMVIYAYSMQYPCTTYIHVYTLYDLVYAMYPSHDVHHMTCIYMHVHGKYQIRLGSFEEFRLRTAGIMESKGMHRVYYPSPVPTLYLGRVKDLLRQIPLIPCFLDGNSTPTIPN